MTATIYEKSEHYYILVQWNEHGKRLRKNCATGLAATAKNERKAEIHRHLLHSRRASLSTRACT